MPNYLKNIFIASVSLILALGLAEIYFRCVSFLPIESNNPYKYTKYKKISERERIENYPLELDARGYYTKSGGDIDYYEDIFGIRRRNADSIKPTAKTSVVVGDSFTYGFGLRFEDSYPELTSKCLESKEFDWTLLNAAHPGLNTIGVLNSYRSIIDKIPHQQLIYGLNLNDVIEFPSSKIISDVPHSSISRFVELSALGTTIFRRLETSYARKRNIEEINRLGNENESYFKTNVAALLDLKNAVEKYDRQFLVLIIPTLIDLKNYPFESVHEVLHKIMKQNNILFLDLLDVFRGRNEQDLWILPIDQHPNENATRIISEALCKHLVRSIDGAAR